MLRSSSNHFAPKALAFVLAVLSLAALAAAIGDFRWMWILQHAGMEYAHAFTGNSVATRAHWVQAAELLGTIVLGWATLAALARRAGALPWIRAGFAVAYLLVGLQIYHVIGVIDVIWDGQLPFGDGILDAHSAFWLKWRYNAPAIGALLLILVAHSLTWRKSVIAALDRDDEDLRGSAAKRNDFDRRRSLRYAEEPGFSPDDPALRSTSETGVPALKQMLASSAPDPSDYLRLSPNQRIRLRGRHDAGYRRGISASIYVHVLLIIVVPWMLTTRGCSLESYLLPGGGGGGGGGGGQPVVVKVQKKEPKRRKYVFRPNSAIMFHTLNLDDSKIQQIVEVATEETYEANTNDVNIGNGPGGPGEGFGGGGGKGGGWAGGDANAKIRFIRLEYKGAAWDDGMDATSRADQNFLDELHKASHLNVTTLNTGEHITVAQLRNFKKGQQPPFLFMTGEGGIELSDAETKVIRQYLLDGGLLFCDCGSSTWDQSFRQWSRRLFPDKQLIDISNDDPIFHAWFHFPNGAPPLWKHGGDRALGIKDNGRWSVFYFPGNLNDAWKTGHNDVNPTVVRQAYELGVNVVKYSIDHYWAMNRQNAGR